MTDPIRRGRRLPLAGTPGARRSAGTSRQILAVADMAIIATDESGIIFDANNSAATIFGYNAGELSGLSVHELVQPHLRPLHEIHLRRFVESDDLARHMGSRGEITGCRKDGSVLPLEVSLAKFRDGDSWILVATMRDMTAADVKPAPQSAYDHLTGLLGRAHIHERLKQCLNLTRGPGTSIALLLINLDTFKSVNDTFGQAAGDHLLKKTAQRLTQAVRPSDMVARVGGDEFAVLCEHVETAAAISSLAERLLETVREPVTYGEHRMFVTASIGIAIGHGTTHSSEDILRSADAALSTAKDNGGGGWRIFSEGLQEDALRRLAISNGLHMAIERNELSTMFQPIVDAESGAVAGAELLLRWHPSEGSVSPALFIPVAELNGAIVPIGYWVFEQACRAESDWRRRLGAKAPYVSFNLSARQLSDPSIEQKFRDIIALTGADPRRLLLEVTETSLMADVSSNRVVLERLTSLGMQIAVDDFGTGYSSLSQLLHLNLDVLKIDREFVDGLGRANDSAVIVSSICRIARNLRLTLVAEGVETQDQRNVLRMLGCRYIQGYLFHRPMPADDLVRIVAESTTAPASSDSGIRFLIYASRENLEVNDTTINEILEAARKANQARGLTGYLLYMHGTFAQYLEGEADEVEAIFARISGDPRHRDVTVIARGSIGQRLFNGWSMGFHTMGRPQLLQSAGIVPADDTSTFDWLTTHPSISCSVFEAISLDAL